MTDDSISSNFDSSLCHHDLPKWEDQVANGRLDLRDLVRDNSARAPRFQPRSKILVHSEVSVAHELFLVDIGGGDL